MAHPHDQPDCTAGSLPPGPYHSLRARCDRVSAQNDTIRGRYLELEEAWQGMIDENKAVHEKNVELRDTLEVRRSTHFCSHAAASDRVLVRQASQAQCKQLEAEKACLEGTVCGARASLAVGLFLSPDHR